VGGSRSESLAWRSEKEDFSRVRGFCSDCGVGVDRSFWALWELRVSSVVLVAEEAEVVVGVVVEVAREESQNTTGERRRIEDVARRIAVTWPGYIRKNHLTWEGKGREYLVCGILRRIA
jgi:hypothetical protein